VTGLIIQNILRLLNYRNCLRATSKVYMARSSHMQIKSWGYTSSALVQAALLFALIRAAEIEESYTASNLLLQSLSSFPPQSKKYWLFTRSKCTTCFHAASFLNFAASKWGCRCLCFLFWLTNPETSIITVALFYFIPLYRCQIWQN
jgi:hypothetical protein